MSRRGLAEGWSPVADLSLIKRAVQHKFLWAQHRSAGLVLSSPNLQFKLGQVTDRSHGDLQHLRIRVSRVGRASVENARVPENEEEKERELKLGGEHTGPASGGPARHNLQAEGPGGAQLQHQHRFKHQLQISALQPFFSLLNRLGVCLQPLKVPGRIHIILFQAPAGINPH